MSDLHARLEARLNLVRRDLDEAVSRLDNVEMDWAPAPGMRTIGGQLLEIAATEHQVQLILKTGQVTSYLEVHRALEKQSLAEYKDLLAAIRAETLDYLRSLSEADLQARIAMPLEYSESLGMDDVPREEVFRSIAQHEGYHVGQLVSYLWARGDDPYDW